MDHKQKMFNISNFISKETGRLSSLSLKRDLSLGGNKNKKIYKPNLNAVRNKNRGKPAANNKSPQQNKRAPRNLSNRNSPNNRYIQSASVFSEGAGDLKRPTIYSDRHLNHSDRDPLNLAIPKIMKGNWDVNVKQEKSVVDELLAINDSSSSDEDMDYNPVILPLKENKGDFMRTFKIKKELMKKEIKEEIKSPVHNSHHDFKRYYEMPLSFQSSKFYNEDHPCISLLRMPDSLPGKGFVEDSDKIVDYDLNQMLEGQIGKVLIRKSGKIEMKIGNMTYNLDTIESNPFKEDLMYIPDDLKTECFGPDMICLGNIDEKYVLSPTWKDIFELKPSKK